MPALFSLNLEIGEDCPAFSLPSVDGKTYSLDSFIESKSLLIAFICNHCPYVRAIEDRLIALSKAYSAHDLQVVGICSNDFETYTEDAPAKLLSRSLEKKYGFPYLVDETQSVARAFNAQCTPDLYLYDEHRRLFYHGRLDDSWKDPAKVTKEELKEAIEAVLEGRPPPKDQSPTMGCSIKWKKA